MYGSGTMDANVVQHVTLPLAAALHIMAVAAVAVHCLQARREPAPTVAWIFVTWSVPALGALCYLVFGINKVREKGWLKQRSDDTLLSVRREREQASLPLHYWRALRDARADEPDTPAAHALNRTIDGVLDDCPLLSGNRVEVLVTGDRAFPRMLEAIEQATEHIHLQTFIIGNDAVGRKFLDTLKRKAAEGVRCRVLYDRFGCTRAWMRGLFRDYRNIEGLELVGWTQANPVKRQYQVNLRNHRKLLVVDGKEAFIGGINLHAGHTARPGRDAMRDYHFAVAGPLVLELQYVFLRDWYFMTDESTDVLLSPTHFPHVDPVGDSLIRVVNGGPTAEAEAMTDVTCAAIHGAVRQLLIATPYFVPPAEIVRALRLAALRGVNVRLVLPKKNNHFYAGLAGQAFYEELLVAGVQIHERRPPFMHAKAMVVDDLLSIVGTANLDTRSLRLNYETNLVIFDETFADSLKRVVLEDVAASVPLSLAGWRERPMRRKVAENLCALLRPVL